MEARCKFWLPKKNRFCANTPLNDSPFCGNHTPRSDAQWIPCPLDPSHSVLQDNLEGHIKRCPLLKQTQSLSMQPFYQKGINAGNEDEDGVTLSNLSPWHPDNVTSEMKRNAVYGLSVLEFCSLIDKIKSLHKSICGVIRDSFKVTDACDIWIKGQVDRKLPFQEKHVKQQASILGNMVEHGVLKRFDMRDKCDDEGQCVDDENKNDVPAVVEFGAGRGYLTQMLADCYGIKRVFLVERKAYKLKADRSLRQKESLLLERLRIDIEDLNLHAVESLRGSPFLAIGKHLCGPATDLTLRCCLSERNMIDDVHKCPIQGLAITTCCHHLCQWKHYINKRYFLSLGIKKEEFHAITWFTSWAVDADHGSDLSDAKDPRSHLPTNLRTFCLSEKEEDGEDATPVKDTIGKMEAVERAVLGFMCKQIIDIGRLMWLKGRGLDAQLVKYVPPTISPENHLLIAKRETRL